MIHSAVELVDDHRGFCCQDKFTVFLKYVNKSIYLSAAGIFAAYYGKNHIDGSTQS